MPEKICIAFVTAVLLFVGTAHVSYAQFREKPFQQNYNEPSDTLNKNDTTDKLINFKEVFGGLAHKRSMRIGTMFGTSLFIPGASQIYNKEYWKLPIFYTGIAGGLAGGITCHYKYKNTGNQAFRTASIWSFVGAGVFYYASLMDGCISYKADRRPYAGRATIYSILCPGLGQAYNGEYWKIPIYVGGVAGSVYFYTKNRTQYIRFRDIYREAMEPGYKGPVTAEQAKYFRDEYRRYRDYSVVAIAAFYLLQIIDANVFSYMNDFDVSDNVQARIAPSVILPDDHVYASAPRNSSPAAGLSFALKF